MNDQTVTWRDLMFDLDKAAWEAERKKIEAMTLNERADYLKRKLLESMVNMP